VNKKSIIKIVILVAILIIIILIAILTKKYNNVVMQLVQVEDYTYENKIINEIKIQENQVVELSEQICNV